MGLILLLSCRQIMASEVEETLKRLVAHKGVIGTIVVNTDGVPIKSTLDNATTVQYSGLLNNLVDQAKTMFKELDPTNDLTFLRIRTKVRDFAKRKQDEVLRGSDGKTW